MIADGFVVNVRSVSSLSLCSSNEQIHCANCKRRMVVPTNLRANRQMAMFADQSRITSESQRKFIDSNNGSNNDDHGVLSSGASVAILHRDDVLYRHEFDNHEPNLVMCVYSMTKIVASNVCLQLVERGQLSLDNNISTYIPSFDNNGGNVNGNWKTRITIRQCLSHTTGFNYPAHPINTTATPL